MKKRVPQKHRHWHLLAFIAILVFINVSLIVLFKPDVLVFPKEPGDTQFGTPPAPTNLAAIANSSSQISLSWQQGPTGEFDTPTSFIIYRTIGNDLNFSGIAQYDSVPLSQLTYVDSGLTPGVTYNYKVAGRNGSLEGENSNLASATTPLPPPGQPTGVTANATAHNQIQLSWNAPPGATLYRIYRKQNEPAFSELSSGVNNSFTDNAVAPNLTYSYYIVAENSSGASAPSETVSATTPSQPSSPGSSDIAPPQISNVAVQKNSTEATISWQTNEVAAGTLEYGKTQNYGAVITLGQNIAHQALLSNLEPATTYYYKISATDGAGNRSEYVNAFTTLSLTVPLVPPHNFKANTSTGKIILTWQNPTDNPGFRGVRVLKKVGSPSETSSDGEIVVNGAVETVTDMNAVPEVSYFYTAYSFDDQNNVSAGTVVSVRLTRVNTLPTTTPPVINPTTTPAVCNPRAVDCSLPACSAQSSCKKPISPVSPTVSTMLSLNAITFLAAERQLTLALQGNQLQGLPERKVVVSVPRDRLTRTPQAVYLMRGMKRTVLQYFPARQSYETELNFLTTPQIEPITLIVEYNRTTVARANFSLETVPLGQVTSPTPSSSIQITLLSENGKRVVVPEAVPNPAILPTYGWMVPNGRYYLRIVQGKEITTTPVFEVTNNIVNHSVALQSTKIVSSIAVRSVGEVTNIFIREVVVPITGALVIIGLLVQVSLFNILALLRLIFLQPILLVGKRERQAWGQVYNSLNKLPVDLATVRLVNASTNQIMQTRVTGRSGRYFFKIGPGVYRLEVVKDGMLFPSTLLMSAKNDGRKTDLYHGGSMAITEQHPIVTATIPVDPKVEEKTLSRLWWERAGRFIQVGLSLFGLGITIYSIVLTPAVWYLWLLLLIHAGVLALFVRLAIPHRPQGWGVVKDRASKRPLSNAIAKLYNTQHNRLVGYELTDRHGRYFFLAGDSTYQVRFEKAEYKVQMSQEIDVRGKEEENVAIDTGLEREDQT